ncbi:hypothetical protein BpHYR1_041707 [Brachionus plicatilis]|uniref:Uncharacterized protein n=1 Tax=Brachionus plicatilis TaxID=10195 RepID=A0A3M7Q841_BRAPC|nr:hypothetical protein BpHYR1_041707 [Brachionus plicatilis]
MSYKENYDKIKSYTRARLIVKACLGRVITFHTHTHICIQDVRIEKPGILLTAPIDEPGPLTQEPIPELISEYVVADENTPTTSSAVVESSGDEEEQLPKQLTRASLKRKMTISKSFEMLSVRDDQDWLNLQRKQSNNDSLNRMARDNFAKNEELHIRISRLEKNLGEINKKLDALECLPKILEVLSSNQKPIFISEKKTTEIEAQGPIFRSEKGTPGIENQGSNLNKETDLVSQER